MCVSGKYDKVDLELISIVQNSGSKEMWRPVDYLYSNAKYKQSTDHFISRDLYFYTIFLCYKMM